MSSGPVATQPPPGGQDDLGLTFGAMPPAAAPAGVRPTTSPGLPLPYQPGPPAGPAPAFQTGPPVGPGGSGPPAFAPGRAPGAPPTGPIGGYGGPGGSGPPPSGPLGGYGVGAPQRPMTGNPQYTTGATIPVFNSGAAPLRPPVSAPLGSNYVTTPVVFGTASPVAVGGGGYPAPPAPPVMQTRAASPPPFASPPGSWGLVGPPRPGPGPYVPPPILGQAPPPMYNTAPLPAAPANGRRPMLQHMLADPERPPVEPFMTGTPLGPADPMQFRPGGLPPPVALQQGLGGGMPAPSGPGGNPFATVGVDPAPQGKELRSAPRSQISANKAPPDSKMGGSQVGSIRHLDSVSQVAGSRAASEPGAEPPAGQTQVPDDPTKLPEPIERILRKRQRFNYTNEQGEQQKVRYVRSERPAPRTGLYHQDLVSLQTRIALGQTIDSREPTTVQKLNTEWDVHMRLQEMDAQVELNPLYECWLLTMVNENSSEEAAALKPTTIRPGYDWRWFRISGYTLMMFESNKHAEDFSKSIERGLRSFHPEAWWDVRRVQHCLNNIQEMVSGRSVSKFFELQLFFANGSLELSTANSYLPGGDRLDAQTDVAKMTKWIQHLVVMNERGQVADQYVNLSAQETQVRRDFIRHTLLPEVLKNAKRHQQQINPQYLNELYHLYDVDDTQDLEQHEVGAMFEDVLASKQDLVVEIMHTFEVQLRAAGLSMFKASKTTPWIQRFRKRADAILRMLQRQEEMAEELATEWRAALDVDKKGRITLGEFTTHAIPALFEPMLVEQLVALQTDVASGIDRLHDALDPHQHNRPGGHNL